ILEVETLVTNHGTRAAHGRLVVAVLNREHRVLATQPPASRPFVVSVPRYDAGGDQGITVQVPGTYNLNHLLDGVDRAHDGYCIRISVSSVDAPDSHLLNNVAVKCYNVSTQIVG